MALTDAAIRAAGAIQAVEMLHDPGVLTLLAKIRRKAGWLPDSLCLLAAAVVLSQFWIAPLH